MSFATWGEAHGRGNLNEAEWPALYQERILVRYVRGIAARDYALIAGQLYLGFRISEMRSLMGGYSLV